MSDQQQRLEDIDRLLNQPDLPDDIRASLFREGGELWARESTERFSWGVEEPWMAPVRAWRRMSHEAMVADVRANRRAHRAFLDHLDDNRRGWRWEPNQAFAQWLRGRPGVQLVADVGCGFAHLARHLSDTDIAVRSFDLSALVDGVEVADAIALPLEDGSVDVVVMGCSLWGDKVAQLSEASRVLREGGFLLVAEPESHWRQGHLEELIGGAGFALLPVKSDDVGRFIFTAAVKVSGL